ncbi:MAG: hypothetical protein JNJ98_00615 [Gemmatimonadetes bacterium]|nr:hypothetical protein [Gemmatimonadota bacterium]
MIELLPFFEWCEASALGQVVRTSVWLFPVIEAGHLLALCLLGAGLLVVDARMLGRGLTDVPIAEIHAALAPWLRRGVWLLIATGVPLFMSEAVKCYYNPSFWVKMATLPVAIVFTWRVRSRVARTAGEATAHTRLVAATSMALWFVVAAAGRWIGFSS